MSRLARIPLLVLIALTVWTGAALADRTYKWVDEDGVTHYSQHPPPDREAEIIEPSIGKPVDAEGSVAAPDAPETEGTDAGGESGGETAEGAPEDMEAYCNQLRRQDQMLADQGEVSVRREDGSLEPLEGDARAARRAEIQQRIEMHCS